MRQVWRLALAFAMFLGLGSALALAQCVPPPSGMVAWWPGDGNANDIVGTNNGTLQNGASFSAGKVGQAFSFDGVDDYVLVPDAPDLDITTGITIDAWINLSQIDQIDGAPVLAKGPGFFEAYAFDLLASGDLRFYFREVPGEGGHYAAQVVNWLTADKVGAWTHVAGSYDSATGNLEVYVNGVLAASAGAPVGTLILTNDDPVSIGSRRGSPSTGYDRNLAGQLDEVEIYSRALSQAEIQAIFLAGSAGKCHGFLTFPLRNKGAYTAAINSVFDHSASFQYCPDGVVKAYTGEEGRSDFDSFPGAAIACPLTGKRNVLKGYQQNLGGTPFSIKGQYAGGETGPRYLFYDGHPGYDYRTTDQRPDGLLCPDGTQCNPSGQTPVVAAADGTVVCVRSGEKPAAGCTEGPGEVKLDHHNGYFTVYLHLSEAVVTAGQDVTGGSTIIGISGATGAQGKPHLHFEVKKRIGSALIPVDPYGWEGQGDDPYPEARNDSRATNQNLWK